MDGRAAHLLILALAVLAAVTGCASRGEVRSPLPEELRIQKPSSDIPESVAAFSGIWSGKWETHNSTRSFFVGDTHTLVVERIEPTVITERPAPSTARSFTASVICSQGDVRGHRVGSYVRGTGRIDPDGVLRLWFEYGPTAVTYELSPTKDRVTVTSVWSSGDSRVTSIGTLWPVWRVLP